jgi:hypothetical protein
VLVPEEGLGIVVLTNGMTGLATPLAYRVLDAYLGGNERDWAGEALPGWLSSRERFEARQRAPEQNRVAGTSPSLALAGYKGTYGGPMYGDATVSEEGGRLVLRLLPNPDLVADLEHLWSTCTSTPSSSGGGRRWPGSARGPPPSSWTSSGR